MIKAEKIHDEIFMNFRFDIGEKAHLSQLYADYLSGFIRSGHLPVGYQFPTIEFIHAHNDLAYNVINKALFLLTAEGYLKLGRGIKTHVISDHSRLEANVKSKYEVYANFYCQPSNYITKVTERNYYKSKTYHMNNIPPGNENATSPSLIATFSKRFNNMHHQSYTPENIYYSHSYSLLMRSIGKAIISKKGVIVIPKNADGILRSALKFHYLKIIEIDSDEHGIDMIKLAQLCKVHHVCGVFMMSAANFPNCSSTSIDRIRNLFELQEKYHFKVVENNFFEPWLSNQHNQILSMAGNSLESVIYVYPVMYSIKDISQIKVVAAGAKIIEAIRLHVISEGNDAKLCVARAINEALLMPDYNSDRINVRVQLSKAVKIIKDVFNASGFWLKEGINQDSGMALFLKPVKGMFPADAFEQLKKWRIHVYNPKDYNGAAMDGIRLDLTYYLPNKNLREMIIWVESICREICQSKKKK